MKVLNVINILNTRIGIVWYSISTIYTYLLKELDFRIKMSTKNTL